MHNRDNRYDRERLRDATALRMIGFEARTCTIRTCTGLSDDRIRRLYKHFLHSHPRVSVKRHRGKSPRQLGYFMRNSVAQLESSTFASFLASHGLLHARRDRVLWENAIEYGAKFCDAYGEYCKLSRAGQLSFEHAWFLRRALISGNELYLERCKRCAGTFVSDMLSTDLRGCPLCRSRRHINGKAESCEIRLPMVAVGAAVLAV